MNNYLLKIKFTCHFSVIFSTYCSLKSSIGGSNLMGLDGKLPSLALKEKEKIYAILVPASKENTLTHKVSCAIFAETVFHFSF